MFAAIRQVNARRMKSNTNCLSLITTECNTVLFSAGDLSSEQLSRVWFRRLGMPNLKDLQKATKDNTMKGLHVSSRLQTDDDPTVIQARFKRKPFKGGELDMSSIPPFHTMSMDEVSGFANKTYGGSTSAFVCVCHRTNYHFVYLVKSREQCPEVIALLSTEIKSLGDYELRRVWSDSAPEIQAGDSRKYCNQHGIKLEPTGVNCPDAGGKHETAVQIICHRARAMMMLAPWMPPNTWGLALRYAAYVVNLTPTTIHGEFKTPMERVTGKTPDLRRRIVHVFGCKVSYGLTNAQRMVTEEKKLSSLTAEYQFAGAVGIMVILREQTTGKLYQGNRQKCHFYEGIFAMRQPPKQLNPIALIEEERQEYIESLRSHGLIDDGEDASDGAKDGLEMVRSIQQLKPVEEVYDSIKGNFEKLSSGGVKLFDSEEMTVTPEITEVNPMQLHDADDVDRTAQTVQDVETASSEPDSETSISGVRNKRQRKCKDSSVRTEIPRAEQSEIEDKVESYGKLNHPSDGTTAEVVDAVQRKAKGKDKMEWWLKLRWDDGFEKFYKEESLRSILQLDETADKSSVVGETRKRSSVTPENTQRARLPRQCKVNLAAESHTLRPKIIVDMHNCLSLGLTRDYDSDAEEIICQEHRTFQTAVQRIRPLFPTPQKEWTEPKNAWECLQQEDWRGWILAAQMEHKSWIDQHVFKIIRKREREPGRNTYPLNDIWKRKFNASDGSFDKHKARLVVLGNLFRRGFDCGRNTWAPTASASAVRIFLYISVQLGYPIWKFDIRTAFLLALADGKYYCFYPALFRMAEMSEGELQECRRIVLHGTKEEQRKLKRELCGKYSDDEDRVLEILRSVYGSPSAPRCFYLHFQEILRSMGWKATESEPCLFQKEVDKGQYMRMVIHVDDGAVSGPPEHMTTFFEELKQKVKITMSKVPRDFTGIGINYDVPKGQLNIHLRTNIEDTVRRFEKYFPPRMYASATPLPAGTVFEAATDEEYEQAKHLPYQQLIGCLVWITVQVKIQAATAVSMLGSHAAKWSVRHFNAALKVLKWMEKTKDKGLLIRRDRNFDHTNCLHGYADADLAGDPTTRKSRSGMVIMMGCETSATCISHRSSLQKTIALSTTAAEILALIEASTPIEGIRFLLAELHMAQKVPTVIYEDNQPCIAVTSDAAKPMGEHTKFYDMRVKKLKEMQSAGIIKVKYCRTASMLADIFTKNVNAVVFERLADIITGNRGTRRELAMFLQCHEQ